MNDRKIIWRCLTMFDNVWRCLIKWNNSWLRILVNNSIKSSSRVLQIILFQSNPNIFFPSSFSKILLSCKELKFILYNLFIILISYPDIERWMIVKLFDDVWQCLIMFDNVWWCLIKWNNSWLRIIQPSRPNLHREYCKLFYSNPIQIFFSSLLFLRFFSRVKNWNLY